MRKIQVPLTRYAHPEFLRDLRDRVEACYFSGDRDWSCIEAIFNIDIKKMEEREPKTPGSQTAKGIEDMRRQARSKFPDMLAPRRGARP